MSPCTSYGGGAARERIRVYQWIGGDRPSDVAEQARKQVEAGFTALKMNATEEIERVDDPATIDAAATRLREVREAVGDEVGIGVDFHGRVSSRWRSGSSRRSNRTTRCSLKSPSCRATTTLSPNRRTTTTPIATGERMYSRWDFKEVFEDGAVDVIQPDVSHAGGITEMKKIAAMAEAYDVAMAPHCPLGPIALASCLQVDACSPNAFIQEQSLNIHYNETSDVLDYLADPSVFDYEDGYVQIP